MERLQKVIANAGICSRREAEQLITANKVKVNGVLVNELGTKVAPTDKIEVNDTLINFEEKVYLILNKPKNCVSTLKDDRGRPTVIDYLKGVNERVYPIGRLDFDTTGVLLFTNDGELANQLAHPSHNVNKVYIATVKGVYQKQDLLPLEKGVAIDYKLTAPAKVRIITVNQEKNYTVIELIIHEGRNRQVKRMFEAINIEVMKLNRDQFAGLKVGDLELGAYRYLTKAEVEYLKGLGKKK
jgi:23S rRNA pseudouridine2605 synthase